MAGSMMVASVSRVASHYLYHGGLSITSSLLQHWLHCFKLCLHLSNILLSRQQLVQTCGGSG